MAFDMEMKKKLHAGFPTIATAVGTTLLLSTTFFSSSYLIKTNREFALKVLLFLGGLGTAATLSLATNPSQPVRKESPGRAETKREFLDVPMVNRSLSSADQVANTIAEHYQGIYLPKEDYEVQQSPATKFHSVLETLRSIRNSRQSSDSKEAGLENTEASSSSSKSFSRIIIKPKDGEEVVLEPTLFEELTVRTEGGRIVVERTSPGGRRTTYTPSEGDSIEIINVPVRTSTELTA